MPNWHLDLIAYNLEQAFKGKVKRLIINVPPRSLKSVSVSVAWPAWILGKNPAKRIMTASYSQILSLKHSIDCRHLMMEDWYQKLFPETILTKDQNEKSKFLTTKRGFRFVTSVGGTATGEGGDILIVDDPHNPIQANSETQRNIALNWFDQTFSTRLNNKKKGVIVVVMQRLHENDLTGHLLSKKGVKWKQISLPIIAQNTKTYSFHGIKKQYKKSELLNGEREGVSEINNVKEELGSHAFSAQYSKS